MPEFKRTWIVNFCWFWHSRNKFCHCLCQYVSCDIWYYVFMNFLFDNSCTSSGVLNWLICVRRIYIYILKSPFELHPKYAFATNRFAKSSKGENLSRVQYYRKLILKLNGIFSKALVQNTLPNVIKSCTVLQQFTVVTMLYNIPKGCSVEKKIYCTVRKL